MTSQPELTDRPLLDVLRWRFTNGNIWYWHKLIESVGVTLALAFTQLSIWGGGEQPWSILGPLLAPFAIYYFIRGWAYAKGLPYLGGWILLMIGGVFPFAMIG